MPISRLKDFLDDQHVKYVTIQHSKAFTAQEVAASAHIPGKELAKTVIVKIDGKIAMAVLPASYKINLSRFKEASNASHVELASESEFKEFFPECETGAMPPFGNLYNMDVYVEESLVDDEQIAFNAGSHTELLKISYEDFENLVHPKIAKFTTFH